MDFGWVYQYRFGQCIYLACENKLNSEQHEVNYSKLWHIMMMYYFYLVQIMLYQNKLLVLVSSSDYHMRLEE